MNARDFLNRLWLPIFLLTTAVITLVFVVGSLMFLFMPSIADWQVQAVWAFCLTGMLTFLRSIWPQGLWKTWSIRAKYLELALTGLFFGLLAAFAMLYMRASLGAWAFAFGVLFLFQGLIMFLWAWLRKPVA